MVSKLGQGIFIWGVDIRGDLAASIATMSSDSELKERVGIMRTRITTTSQLPSLSGFD